MIAHTLADYINALDAAGILREHTLPQELTGKTVQVLTYDTRELTGASALFLCKGAHFKAQYLADAFEKGALAYVSEWKADPSLPGIYVNDIRYAMVVLGRLFYDNVTDKLIAAGITGTKGKSTTAYYLRAILNEWFAAEGKKPCGVLSSIDVYDGVIDEESHLTTPEVLDLYRHFENARRTGLTHMVMEVSSQALKYGRVRSMRFDVACFTNIGTDHISPIEHPDFEDYFASKLKIFDCCDTACVNTDMQFASRVLSAARGKCRLITFGSHETDDIILRQARPADGGIDFTVAGALYEGDYRINMPGLFNVENALAAMAMAKALGVPEPFVREGLLRARVSGRMQVYTSRDKEVSVIVDYAHNRMSFEALFSSCDTEYPGCEKIAIFGCPGKKAQLRRKDLGEIAGKRCAFVYITEEDSGEEPFAEIARDIADYVACPHRIEEDRAACIRDAILNRTGKRVILLTGKGEETRMKRGLEYQPYPSDASLTVRFLAEYDARNAEGERK